LPGEQIDLLLIAVWVGQNIKYAPENTHTTFAAIVFQSSAVEELNLLNLTAIASRSHA